MVDWNPYLTCGMLVSTNMLIISLNKLEVSNLRIYNQFYTFGQCIAVKKGTPLYISTILHILLHFNQFLTQNGIIIDH